MGGPKSFDILFPFTTSCTYSPVSGNLAVQFAINSSDGIPVFLDATAASPAEGRLFGGVSNTTGAFGGDNGFILQFTTQAPSGVPEPATWVLLAVGLAMLEWRRRHHQIG